jgi:uncharacterized OB-fold protein/acyl dehydratase
MAQATREELEAKLKTYVGQATGPAQTAPDAVNEAMIRHWCEAMGDRNPIYTDAAAAKSTVHGGLVAPPTMMQAWVLRGLEMADPNVERGDKQTELHKLLTDNGYPSVVATNCEQGYTRYLKPGDRVSTTTVIESISEQKSTGLGIGYFINTRDIFRDQSGNEVGWMTFRVLKFKPHQQPAAAASDAGAGAQSAKPKRLAPPLGHDNGWWWEGIGRGEILIQKCSDCGKLRHPPRPMCGECQSIKWTGVKTAGRGSVYSYVILHYPKFPGYEFPLACGLIELEEGVRMVTNIVGCEHSAIKIGMTGKLVIEKVDGDLNLPLFRADAK